MFQIQIDYRRDVERQELADQQAPDYGEAQRLAGFGAFPVSQSDGQRSKERSYRCHHDGPEPQQAALPDGVVRADTLFLGVNGEVDHHDRILFNYTEQHDDTDEGVEVKLLAEDVQRQQCSEDGGGQAGENRDRMDEALIENAQHNVNYEYGDEQQDRQILERTLELLHGALESSADGTRHTQVEDGIFHLLRSVSQRGSGFEIKSDGYGRKLPEMTDAERSGGPLHSNQGVERHQRSLRRAYVNFRQGVWIAAELRLQFQHHRVFVGGGVDDGD